MKEECTCYPGHHFNSETHFFSEGLSGILLILRYALNVGYANSFRGLEPVTNHNGAQKTYRIKYNKEFMPI